MANHVTTADILEGARIAVAMISYLHERGLMVGGRLLDNAADRLGIEDDGAYYYSTPESSALLSRWTNILGQGGGSTQAITYGLKALPEVLHNMMASYTIECGIIHRWPNRTE